MLGGEKGAILYQYAILTEQPPGFNSPKCVDSEDLHEFLGFKVLIRLVSASDARIGKEDVKTPVVLQGVTDDILDRLLIGCVEAPGMYINFRVQRVYLAFVTLKIRVIKVAEVDCLGSVVGKLMRSCTPNSQDRVCA